MIQRSRLRVATSGANGEEEKPGMKTGGVRPRRSIREYVREYREPEPGEARKTRLLLCSRHSVPVGTQNGALKKLGIHGSSSTLALSGSELQSDDGSHGSASTAHRAVGLGWGGCGFLESHSSKLGTRSRKKSNIVCKKLTTGVYRREDSNLRASREFPRLRTIYSSRRTCHWSATASLLWG